jgi:hypothetical protein
MRSLPEERVSFSGHETFPLRYAWLPKAVEAVLEDPTVFARDDALIRLGVGKNMVKAIRHWALTTGVIEEVEGTRGRSVAVSQLGLSIFGKDGWDPYLEDPATIWLLHWEIASRRQRATTWYYAFSHLSGPRFSKDELLVELSRVAEDAGSRTSPASLGRDIDCFVRCYCASRPSRTTPIEDTLDGPLVELGLIREVGKGEYLIQRGEQASLPVELLAYSILEFLGGSHSAAKTASLESIAYSPGSPGRVFCVSEDALVAKLESLSGVTGGALTFDETAGLRQVLVHGSPAALEVLKKYYSQV